ncbi:MAG: hypothetical protein ACPGLY_27570 [Rubripirellula sp.]
MTIGLTFDEFVNVKLRPTNEDVPKHRSADVRAAQLFPMTTTEAANHLRSRGYDSPVDSLEELVKDGVLSLDADGNWTREAVDEAADFYERCELFVPYATMCQALGCRYVDWLVPLRNASERESKRLGRHVPPDDQYFAMHRVPPIAETDDDGNLVNIRPAEITFTLLDEVRREYEAGENE